MRISDQWVFTRLQRNALIWSVLYFLSISPHFSPQGPLNVSFKYTSSVQGAITQDTLSHRAPFPSLLLSVWQESEIHSLCPGDRLPSGMAGMYPKENGSKGKKEGLRGEGGSLAGTTVKKGTAHRRGGHVKVKASSSGMGRLGSVTV